MNNVYFLGQNFIIFGLGLLCSHLIFYIFRKLNSITISYERWFPTILSICFILLDKIFVAIFPLSVPLFLYIGILNLIVLLPITILSLRFVNIIKHNILYWTIGILLLLVGVGRLVPSSGSNPDCFIIGLGWILFTLVLSRKKILKLNRLNFLACLFLISGITLFSIINIQFYTQPHIEIEKSSTKMKKLSAEISGTATPNSEIRTFLNGNEVTPVEKTNIYGDFSFIAKAPGIWKLQITKNGKTKTDTIKITESKAYHEHQIMKEAKDIMEKFSNIFSETYSRVDSLGVDEYNAWLKYVKEDSDFNSPNEVIDSIQENEEHKGDVQLLSLNVDILAEYVKKLKKLDIDSADEYLKYYQDMNTLVKTVMSPSGNLTSFGDSFDAQRNIVSNDEDLLEL